MRRARPAEPGRTVIGCSRRCASRAMRRSGALMVVVAADLHRGRHLADPPLRGEACTRTTSCGRTRTTPHVGVGRLLPLVGRGPRAVARTPSSSARSGPPARYDPAGQTLVRSRTVGDDTGFLVVTPLRTADAHAAGGPRFRRRGRPAAACPSPAGAADRPGVTVSARARAPETRHDDAAELSQRPGRVDQPGASRPVGSAGRSTTATPSSTPASPAPAGVARPRRPRPVQPGRRRARAAALRLHHPVVPVRRARAAAPFVMARAETKRDATATSTTSRHRTARRRPIGDAGRTGPQRRGRARREAGRPLRAGGAPVSDARGADGRP